MRVATVLVLVSACCAAATQGSAGAGGGGAGGQLEDALRVLQDLDRYYAHATRPRVARGGGGGGGESRLGAGVEAQQLDRAVRLLQLHNLDRYYSYHTRPRFGKRAHVAAAGGAGAGDYPSDYQAGDEDDYIPAAPAASAPRPHPRYPRLL